MHQELIDRPRLEADLRRVVDSVLQLLPPIPPWLAMTLGRSIDLRRTGYATCQAIAALPDDDLVVVLWTIDRELREISPLIVSSLPAEPPDDARIQAAFAKVVQILGTPR